MTRRGTTNRNARGSSTERRRRREWLVVTFGNGETCPCHDCGRTLTTDEVVADRIVPGIEGGTYRRGNIRPQCLPCSCVSGGHLAAKRNRERTKKAALAAKTARRRPRTGDLDTLGATA